MTAEEKKYKRKRVGYIWTHKTNTEITKELNITPVLVKTQEHRGN